MNRNLLSLAMIASAVAGLSVSAYLTYLSLLPPRPSCPVDDLRILLQ